MSEGSFSEEVQSVSRNFAVSDAQVAKIGHIKAHQLFDPFVGNVIVVDAKLIDVFEVNFLKCIVYLVSDGALVQEYFDQRSIFHLTVVI